MISLTVCSLKLSSTFLKAPIVNAVQVCGIKHFLPPPTYADFKFPERTKLRTVDKVPILPASIKPPKMQKKLRFMRGPEEVHNFLLYKQYGIMATCGGRLRYGHYEMMRLTIGRKLDTTRMFAIWRIDSPWQPVTKKTQGHRMGGGKGNIDHYVTPIKAGRIILEVAGNCGYEEVRKVLEDVALKLPFKAIAVSQEIMDEMKAKEAADEKNNINPFTMKYCIQNNMGGCRRWLSPVDYKWFGKYN